MFRYLMILVYTNLLFVSSKQHDDIPEENSEPIRKTSVPDPVAEILKNVVLLDVVNYLPHNYKYKEDTEEEVKVVEENTPEFKKKEEDSLGVRNQKSDEVVNKDSIVKNAANPSSEKRKKPLPRFTSPPFVPTQSRWQVVAEFRPAIPGGGGSNVTRNALQARRLTSRVITARPLRSRPLTSAPRSRPSSATTTATPPSTSPGMCRAFCNLAGRIVIKSGLFWTQELLHGFTEVYKDVTEVVVTTLSEIFEKVYGNAFEFVTVEAYSQEDENIVVHFYVQFNGHTINNISTAALKATLEEELCKDGDDYKIEEFVIDMDDSYFQVVDTSSPTEISRLGERPGVYILPDWAWVALLGGTVSLIIIAMFGGVACVQVYRRNQVLKRRVLNPKTLETFRGENHFARENVRSVDRRDMWALQRAHQAELCRSKPELARLDSHDDSRAELLCGQDESDWTQGGGQEEAVVDRSVFSRNSKLRRSREDMLDNI